VKGVRDVASGLMTFVLIAAREPRVLAGFMLAATVIPVGDAVIVLRRGGRKPTAYGACTEPPPPRWPPPQRSCSHEHPRFD